MLAVRLLAVLVTLLAVVAVWLVKARRAELARRREEEQLRVRRQERLDQAARAVEQQAAFGRTVADRIKNSPVEIPTALQASVDAVVIELDGVAADLRTSCTPVHAHVHHHRRHLLHR